MNAHTKDLEKRLYPRYSADVKVEIITKGLEMPHTGRTANISLGGLFVCTEYSADLGEKIFVRIIFKDKDAFFDIRTIVRWKSAGGPDAEMPKGVGLEFVDMTEKHKFVINNFLKDYINVEHKKGSHTDQ